MDTGEVAEVVTSNENGEFVFTQFDYGYWCIRETGTPEGYNAMDDIYLNVDSNWTEPEPFTCVNIPNHYDFVKTDNQGHPLAGVKFVLEDSSGQAIRDLVSGDDGIVHVTELIPGTYYICETEALEGYAVSGETMEIVIDENYVVPSKPPVFVNYPNIQTGVDFEITPVMYVGGALILTAIGLMIGIAARRHAKHRRQSSRRKP